MKLKDILKKVGGSIIKEAIPGGGAILSVVNDLLPADKKLGPDATGQDMEKALTSADRLDYLEKEFDVEIEELRQTHETVRAMLVADAATPQTTRPYIVKQSFHLVSFISIVVVSIWAYAVFDGDDDLVKVIQNGWPFVAAIIAPYVTLLYSYFGVIRKENRDKLDASNGVPTGSILNTVAGFLKR